MRTSGDVVDLDLGLPEGREAGFRHPAVVVTAQDTLDETPSVLQVVPVTSTFRRAPMEIPVQADQHNGLARDSVVQCQHIRGIARSRVQGVRGNVGPVVLAEIRETLSLLLDTAR